MSCSSLVSLVYIFIVVIRFISMYVFAIPEMNATGPCLYCATTSGIFSSTANASMTEEDRRAAAAASEARDRLIHYDRTSIRRTMVYGECAPLVTGWRSRRKRYRGVVRGKDVNKKEGQGRCGRGKKQSKARSSKRRNHLRKRKNMTDKGKRKVENNR